MKEKVPTDKVLISGTISHCSVTPHCSERCDYDRGVYTTLATRQYQAKQGLALHLPPCPRSLGCFQLQLVLLLRGPKAKHHQVLPPRFPLGFLPNPRGLHVHGTEGCE